MTGYRLQGRAHLLVVDLVGASGDEPTTTLLVQFAISRPVMRYIDYRQERRVIFQKMGSVVQKMQGFVQKMRQTQTSFGVR
jgi:hypothetical protein